MSVANASPSNVRQLRDANFIVSTLMPNAANAVTTNALNLVQATPYPVTERVVVQLITTAATGANTKNMNGTLQHTDANSDGTANGAAWANIPQLAVPLLQITESGSSYAASSANVLLPPSVKQFIRARMAGEANGGDASNGTLTLQLLF